MTRIHKEKVDVNTYRTFQDQPEANPRNDSSYEVLSVSDVLRDTAKRWTYPVPKERIPEALQPGTIAYPVDQHNFSKVFLSHYIGAPQVDDKDRMYGLDQDVIRKADKSGVIKTAPERTIFLTFDDWGTDNTINQLLYVLRKHKVPATFSSLRATCRAIRIYYGPLQRKGIPLKAIRTFMPPWPFGIKREKS